MDRMPTELSVPETVMQLLLKLSNSSLLEESLQHLIEIAKTDDGRADLATKNIVTVVLQLCQALSYPSHSQILLLSLKLLRNLCAGELVNQNLFLEQGGVGTVSTIISSVKFPSDLDNDIIRLGLQLLGNVALAGGEHQHAVWHELFPYAFSNIAGIRSREICDPFCMVIYTCSEGVDELITELCTDQGLVIILEIIHTVSIVGFKEHWIKLLLLRVCLEGSYFTSIFSKLYPVSANGNFGDLKPKVDYFTAPQAFILSILSEILNERITDIVVDNEFALYVLEILRTAVEAVDCVPRRNSDLPAGISAIDVLRYSLTILRDICACDHGLKGPKEDSSVDVVDMLASFGLVELVLSLLNDLEPPSIIKKGMKQDKTGNDGSSNLSKQCPYKGFRSDLVAIIGNCAYRRKHVQDEVRAKKGILLLLQQCVTDEDNPYLREWGIWSVRNLLEGNAENQRLVADLEMQGTVDVPELAGLGLRVELDPKTHRAKLVNM